MSRNYITLISGGTSRNFFVIPEGFSDPLIKNSNIKRAINGAADITLGAIVDRRSYIIRVRATETEVGFGNYNDLKNFFKQNTPSTAILTLRDHLYDETGISYQVHLFGSLPRKLTGPGISGPNAYFFVEVTMEVV